MDDDVEILKRIYDRFNSGYIDGVLAVLADDVAWANGMDGQAPCGQYRASHDDACRSAWHHGPALLAQGKTSST